MLGLEMSTNFTDLDANSRPVAVVGDGKVRVTGAFNNAECSTGYRH